MNTPYDNIPIEDRRHNWGWFGEPWPSGICYDDDDQLLTDMRKEHPTGENCMFCDEPIEAHHSGQAMPTLHNDGPQIRHVHKECSLRSVLGPVEHLHGDCKCREPDRPTYRREALDLWKHIHRIGTQRRPA